MYRYRAFQSIQWFQIKAGRCSTYPVMDHGFEGVLEFLAEAVGLEDVNDSHEEQQTFTLVISCGNTARPETG